MAFSGFVTRNVEILGNNYGKMPAVDMTRILAVYVRQSKSGADDANGESRETQMGLMRYALIAMGAISEEHILVRLYDEGAGQSGKKRIDERDELSRLYADIARGLISTVIVAREDRLFRDKHGNQSGMFTELAEKMKVQVIVPPIVTPQTSVYDFSNYESLKRFKEKMVSAYDYLVYQVGYMHRMLAQKAGRGEWDGRFMPPGLVVPRDGYYDIQKPVLYKPWADVMINLAKLGQSLNWNWTAINRVVEKMPYLFPEPSEEDKRRYWFKTQLKEENGYKPLHGMTLRGWFSNVSLIGWWLINDNTNEIIIDNHPAVLGKDIFEEAFIALKGCNLDGEAVNPTFVSKKRNVNNPPDALFHGRISTRLPDGVKEAGGISFVSTLWGDRKDIGRHVTYSGFIRDKATMIYPRKLFTISAKEFDGFIIARLKELSDTDKNIAKKIEQGLSDIQTKQATDFVSIEHTMIALEARKKKIQKRLRTISAVLDDDDSEEDDDVVTALATELQEVKQHIQELEAKKKKLNIVDGQEELEKFYGVLSNFDQAYPKMKLDDRQKLFSLLVRKVEINYLSPHWLEVSIHWLSALSIRPDKALLWRNNPKSFGKITPEEDLIIKEHIATAPVSQMLKLLPNRTWDTIKRYQEKLDIKRKAEGTSDHLPHNACWLDLCPWEDGRYLMGNMASTIEAINRGAKATTKQFNTLHMMWLYPSSLGRYEQLALDGMFQPSIMPPTYSTILTNLQTILPELTRLLAG